MLYDTINAIYNCIKAIMDEKKGKVIFKDEDFVLSIPVFLPTGKQEFINFNLKKSEFEKDEIILNLC